MAHFLPEHGVSVLHSAQFNWTESSSRSLTPEALELQGFHQNKTEPPKPQSSKKENTHPPQKRIHPPKVPKPPTTPAINQTPHPPAVVLRQHSFPQLHLFSALSPFAPWQGMSQSCAGPRCLWLVVLTGSQTHRLWHQTPHAFSSGSCL